MLPIATPPGPKDEENTYPSLPKYYFLIKTGLENGPKNSPKNSPIVQGCIGPAHILPYVHILPYAQIMCIKMTGKLKFTSVL